MINGRYYTIHRMPIRLGTGSYGVAGIMYDMTEKVLEQTIYQMQSFVEKLIIELLSEQDVDTVEFMKNIVKKFNEQYPKITVTLLKDNSYVAGREDRKLSERAATIDEIKTMIHDRRTYQVVPVENYKFIIIRSRGIHKQFQSTLDIPQLAGTCCHQDHRKSASIQRIWQQA